LCSFFWHSSSCSWRTLFSTCSRAIAAFDIDDHAARATGTVWTGMMIKILPDTNQLTIWLEFGVLFGRTSPWSLQKWWTAQIVVTIKCDALQRRYCQSTPRRWRHLNFAG
jgi:hypothetical protein